MGFDSDYYRRYYLDPRTAVTSRAEMSARARLIVAVAAHAGLAVRHILDAGCGTGLLRSAVKRLLPRARYVGIDGSEWACRRYGWVHARIEDFRAPSPFDLVVCYDVLQYLDTPTARRALDSLAPLCGGILYFTALTRHDYDHNCDQARTDADVHLRTARWYRGRLAPHFHELGLGFWARRGADLALWDLESGPGTPAAARARARAPARTRAGAG